MKRFVIVCAMLLGLSGIANAQQPQQVAGIACKTVDALIALAADVKAGVTPASTQGEIPACRRMQIIAIGHADTGKNVTFDDTNYDIIAVAVIAEIMGPTMLQFPKPLTVYMYMDSKDVEA